MGDPRKIKPKYRGPQHPWQRARIEEEKQLLKEYGLKNKKEVWKASSKLKNFAAKAKKLIAARGTQADLERTQLLQRLARLNLVKPNAGLDDVLSIKLKDVLDRRLQTLVFKKGFAHTVKQARQFIVHEHITIGDKKVTVPSHFVTVEEEPKISFYAISKLASTDHPERQKPVSKTEITKRPERTEKIERTDKTGKTVRTQTNVKIEKPVEVKK